MARHISYPHPFFLWKHVKACESKLDNCDTPSGVNLPPNIWPWTLSLLSPLLITLCPSILSNTYNEHTLGTFSCRFLRQYFWHWCVALWPATGLLCPCQRVSASRPPCSLPSPPYISTPRLFNQQTSVQAPAHIPSKDPPIRRYIFATFPFLSAH